MSLRCAFMSQFFFLSSLKSDYRNINVQKSFDKSLYDNDKYHNHEIMIQGGIYLVPNK